MRVREAPEALNVLLQLAEDDVGAIASKARLSGASSATGNRLASGSSAGSKGLSVYLPYSFG